MSPAEEYYTTEIMISNNGFATASGVLYRAADAFLGGSDIGYGFTEDLQRQPQRGGLLCECKQLATR